MSRTINFKYDYPYCGYGEKGKYKAQWSASRSTLNGCYTYPMVFNNTAPKCSHIKISIEIENTGSGTIYGRNWDFMVYRQSYGWVDIQTFVMPNDGIYTIDTDIPTYNITQFAFVPSSNPGSNRSWTSWYAVEQLTITESVTTADLITGEFQYGIFPNYYGIDKSISEVFVNIGGTLTKAAEILVNVDDSLFSLPKVYSGYFKSTSEQMTVYEFTVPETGGYRFKNKRLSGDHEIRLYDSGFNELNDGYFYSQSFALIGGTLLYITLTHYYNADTSESYLQIYKEA